MKKLIAGALLCVSQLATAQPAAELVAVRDGCKGLQTCEQRHAIVFVHGIYGGAETFVNDSVSPAFDWPANVPDSLASHPIDVFRLDYRSELVAWAKKDVASLDQVVMAVLPQLDALRSRGYKAINFVAHSLGGNVVTAYLHSVKSRHGHTARAQHGFVITLGTPVNGASIANIGLFLKDLLGMPDPLLSSLQKENTFLGMMGMWAEQEDQKASLFKCRKVHLYAGIESKPLGPVMVVDAEAARNDLPRVQESRVFPLNHSEIAKPASTDAAQFKWFMQIAQREIERIDAWSGSGLCVQRY